METGRRETGREGRGRVDGVRGSPVHEEGEGVLSPHCLIVVGAPHVLVVVVIHCCRPWSLSSSTAIVVICSHCHHPQLLTLSVGIGVVASIGIVIVMVCCCCC